MPVAKCDLKIDWATHAAAKYACEHWHYSKSVPVGKLVKVGAWEDGKYIGVVIFSRGANYNLLKPYRLNQDEGCELTRVALTAHQNPVTRIIKLAVMFLKRNSPGLRLIVSYSDMMQNHYGIIYQAGGWLYVGSITFDSKAELNGKIAHARTFDSAGIKGYHRIESKPKHKYLMPLDDAMRAQVTPLSKPYPKREKQAMAATSGTAAGQHRPSRSINNSDSA